MFFILLTFAAALAIEGLGSLVSVIGISALFGANPIIIALAIALDVGKIVVVSLLYTYWKRMPILMRSYAFIAAAVTMTITSAGAAGYLSGEFQKAIIGTKEGELKVSVLKEQQAKYQERKKQIDDQVANLPTKTTVTQRLRLMNGFKAEQKALDDKIAAIDKDLPDMQIKQIGTEAKAGPILYVAKAFDVPVEQAVKWVILLIIFVFDPLAVFLIIAGNFLWAKRKEGQPPGPRIVNLEDLEPSGPPVPNPMFFAAASMINKITGKRKREEYMLHDTVDLAEDEPMIVELKPTPAPEPAYDPKKPIELDPAAIEEWLNGTKPPEEPIITTSWLDHDVTAPEPEPEPEPSPPEPVPITVPVIETQLPEPAPEEQVGGLLRPINVEPPREEITRSSLSAAPDDPDTLIDARNQGGFRRSSRIVTTPHKK